MQRGKKLLMMTLLLVAGFVVGVQVIKAGNSQNTIGWLWGGMNATSGGNTSLGWVSMNSRDCDADGNGTVDVAGCPAGAIPDYGVNVPLSDGAVRGYGWSENYGWLSFNAADVAGCPVGGCSAQRVGNALTGWARVLSIRDAAANSGGWSGYVSLDSGTTGSGVPYGVTVAGNIISGYAWSDELGWIDFGRARIQPGNSLKICRDSCNSGILRGSQSAAGSNTMGTGAVESLVACWNSDVACGMAGASVPATWAESGSAAVGLSGPDTLKTVTANAVGSESVTATYVGQTATLNVSVICVPLVCGAVTKAVTDTYCPDATQDTGVSDNCGGTLTCPGTRYCDTNYKEVQP
ncbi:MAG: hypothetical protein KA731_01180 [Candidatus Moranbacteria bacterium]|nr:hypothetical protein [Candidatus Moranbacteria bacterium]MBP6034071.1 hypothetical protein [Candidatus Moranbacteria bacterium]MBP7695823.1 hypothetical protein [Candidatus Moranbacteria bacterium]